MSTPTTALAVEPSAFEQGQLIRTCFLPNLEARRAMYRAGLAIVGEEVVAEELRDLEDRPEGGPVIDQPTLPPAIEARRRLEAWCEARPLLVHQVRRLQPPKVPRCDPDWYVCLVEGVPHRSESLLVAWTAAVDTVLAGLAATEADPAIWDVQAALRRVAVLQVFSDAGEDHLVEVFGPLRG